jgi:hypothetical protein
MKKLNQDGLIPMMLFFIALIVLMIALAYMRVSNAN